MAIGEQQPTPTASSDVVPWRTTDADDATRAGAILERLAVDLNLA